MARELDIGLLRSLVAIADTGGFSAAARMLGRSQSAVSMQIQRLEDVLGRRLLTRDTRRVALTEDGLRMVRHARRILGAHDEALAELDARLIDGTVRLGTPDDYATCFLPEPLARFANSHPRVQLEVRCDLSTDLMPLLADGALDLAVVTRGPDGGGLLLRREPLVWAAAVDRPVETRAPVPLVLFPRGCIFRDSAQDALDRAGTAHRIVYTSPSLAGIRAAVLGGLGVTVLARSTAVDGLRVLGPETGLPALPPVEIVLHQSRRRIGPAALELAQHLIRSLRPPVAEAA
ncbi:LysR substrate-binding domain-containing protein [Marinivivus vitaminiproducens]|uniref:LysR substrate-binding domain-containing protein n=1 Tax=Marinivivus vitaminiproducens TaxID=3035935 RepID=UPI002799377F|nr:LysR substrate-binding domain-containing protein [Geminicoccaceae bacterium SCSIO 64248]